MADVIVIGMGVAGDETAGRLAEAGLDVIGIESRLIGGECPYYACIPTKMMVRAADMIAEARRAPALAGPATITPDWGLVAARIRDEATDNWNDQVAVNRFEGKGGRFIRGLARLTGPREVEVNGERHTATTGIVIATGTDPLVPPIEGLQDTAYWTNRDIVSVKELPRSLAILGGGAVGVELAQVMARFGVAVTLIEGSDRLLALEEPESSALVQEALAADGVTVLTGLRAAKVAAGFAVTLSDGSTVRADQLLIATGRRTDLTGLGAGAIGVDPKARFFDVDERMRVADGVWALGDITGKAMFTHTAMYQADIAVRDILGQGGPAADYRAVPRATFTDPEIGAVGLTETQARETGAQVTTGMASIGGSSRGWIHKEGNAGFIKLIAADGVLVGGTSAGPAGGELLAALSVAVQTRMPLADLQHMIFAYPTFARTLTEAAKAAG